jgi:catechol 2,3-dioxygenase-like lactoylglutathione lyase family enzyme
MQERIMARMVVCLLVLALTGCAAHHSHGSTAQPAGHTGKSKAPSAAGHSDAGGPATHNDAAVASSGGTAQHHSASAAPSPSAAGKTLSDSAAGKTPSDNATVAAGPAGEHPTGGETMRLGNFSISLAVKDLAASRAFYEKLGFRPTGGDGRRFQIMQNESGTIGLFQGMFEKNIITFNPGWDRSGKTLAEFDDVRDLQRQFKAQGVELVLTADETSTGPASCMLVDPDGNQILVDQHVPRPQ